MFSSFHSLWTQSYPPPGPLTGRNLPSQTGKVFIVTGGSSGVGFELVKLLYAAGATVYIMTRDEGRALAAIKAMESSSATSTTETTTTTSKPATPGLLKYIHLDLADLSTIPASSAAFLAAESRLDVLWNNAGVFCQPLKHKTAQGLEPHFGINCVGPFLLTKLLLPVLTATARKSVPGLAAAADSVRIVWTSSILVDLLSPKGGVRIAELSTPSSSALTWGSLQRYVSSKVGNWFLASELAKRLRGTDSDGIVTLTQNPGNLRTNIFRNTSLFYTLIYAFLSNASDGACTALWAGLSEEISVQNGSGRYAVPFGRWHPNPRKDLLRALEEADENHGNGTGEAGAFWLCCEKEVEPFLKVK